MLQILSAMIPNVASKFGKTRSRAMSITALASACGFFAFSVFSQAQSANSDGSGFTEAFRKLKRNDSLQFDFTAAPPPPETPEWLIAIGDFITAVFAVLGPVLYLIFWLGVGALIMGFIYLLFTTITAAQMNARSTDKDAAPVPLYQPQHAQARILLDEIDELAAQGKYAEAVHTLLFRSIQDIDANRPNVIRRSLTSREIGELTILTTSARGVFSSIASVVERSFFGGENIGKADFDAARAAYAQLASQSKPWAAPNTQERAA